VTEPMQMPLMDAGNPYIAEYPGAMTLGKLMTPAGDRLALTIRCGPATVTVLLPREAAKQWAAQINQAADNMSRLIVPNGVVIGKPLEETP